MLIAEQVLVENPVLVSCWTAAGGRYWRLDFDVKLVDPDRVVWLALHGARVARGRIGGPVKPAGGVVRPVTSMGGILTRAVLDACRTAGWLERYPGVQWP